MWERFRTDLAALVDALHEQAVSPMARGSVPVALTMMAFQMRPDVARAPRDPGPAGTTAPQQDARRDELP